MSTTTDPHHAIPALLSDNASGIHPDVLAAIGEVNHGQMSAYGTDPVTAEAEALFRRHFGGQARVAFVATGTAANVIGLRSVTDSFQSVICADCSHLYRDECGAPEKFLGCKLMPVPTTDGIVDPAAIEPLLVDNDMVHRVQPRVLSITQSTEWGTAYTRDQIRSLAELCHTHGLLLHVDGARLSNAAAALQCNLAEVSTDLGVDLVSFGGSKNGALAAEAVVLLRPELGPDLPFHRKQGMQLSSKMRFVAAQFVALLKGDLWLRNARHANAMSQLLATRLGALPGVELEVPQATNVVFVRLPAGMINRLQRQLPLHPWDPTTGVVRWMTSFDTTEDDIIRFVTLVAAATGQEHSPQENP